MKKAILLMILALLSFSCGMDYKVSIAVERQKKVLPKEVNSFITWTDINLEGKEIVNIYDVDLPFDLALVELKEFGKSNILKEIGNDDNAKTILGHGYAIAYKYYDEDKKILHEFVIERGDLRE